MPRKNDTGVFEPRGTTHFNLKYKAGAILDRVLARDLEVCRAADIEWVWIVEATTRPTPKVVKQLCSGKWEA